jgi:hypothetical protein
MISPNLVMQCGLANAPAVFMDLMNRSFPSFFWIGLGSSSLDDILIYSCTESEPEEHLRIVLQTLRDHQLNGKFSKYEFWWSEARFLGGLGISLDPSKVEAMLDLRQPSTVIEIQSFF